MKKYVALLLKIFLGLILLILLSLLIIPVAFRDRIKASVENVINESVDAKVTFSDYRLGFFRNFPNISFSLDDLAVIGTGKFEKDTLASCRTARLVFNLKSLFSGSGYEIKSMTFENAAVKTIVHEDGSVNWDIMKDTEESDEEESSSAMKVLLKRVNIIESTFAYIDREANMEAWVSDLNAGMTGDLTLSETNLDIDLTSGIVTFTMDGFKYLNSVAAEAEVLLKANLDSMKFDFLDNYLLMNDLRIEFAGMVAMPEDDIITDLTFGTGPTPFKSLLSLIPAFYMSGFEELQTEGEFNLAGSARGVYSDADSTLPDIALDVKVRNGMISYPSLPEKIKNIGINSEIFVDGHDLDRTKVAMENFHMELAGNPFDMKFYLATPISDPDLKGTMTGKIDLTALSKAMPLDSIDLSGLVTVSVNMAGRLSMIEAGQYEKFNASGNMNLDNLLVAMKGYPEVRINGASIDLSPRLAGLSGTGIKVGSNSDFAVNGQMENYIPYLFSDGILKGKLSMKSDMIDLNEVMSYFETDTSATDTAALTVIKVPENLDLDFTASAGRMEYSSIKADNVKGHLLVKEGVLSIREAGMDMLGGFIRLNADYDTRDMVRPIMKADFSLEQVGMKETFNSFDMLRKFAPSASGVNGKVAMKFSFSSLLKEDFMPLIETISGSGKLKSDEVTLVESAVYDKLKELLKLGRNYSNTFRDLDISFSVSDGKMTVSPFNAKVGNIKMNISGEQGIDQSVNYVIRTEIPRAELGTSLNSLIDNLSGQAAALGATFKPSEIIKVNVNLHGTILKPLITPFFGESPADSTRTGIVTTVKETVQTTVEEKVDEVKDNARARAEEEGDKLVREAEERGQQIRDEAAKAAEKIKKEADTQAQNLISEAESKGAIARLAAQKAAESVRKEADRRAGQLISEADEKAIKLVEEAKLKREQMLEKI
ncbi:MAG: AsmA-like C-terminal region-containing protein [Bacteroidales bacterium]|jgi:hypothetical protein|nr:AsmA-like C-terminal region-containing protein [Bacteroidales bacterium]